MIPCITPCPLITSRKLCLYPLNRATVAKHSGKSLPRTVICTPLRVQRYERCKDVETTLRDVQRFNKIFLAFFTFFSAIHPDIVSITSKKKNEDHLYGVNRAMQMVTSYNLGADWLSLSPNQLSREKQNGTWSNAVNIDDMLPDKFPNDRYRWTTEETNREWGGNDFYLT